MESVKTKMKITVNCLVKNEEKFVWFAINSVLDWVDEILVWDTGSTDKTVEIVKSINSSKIKFQEKGVQTRDGLTALRQQMLKISNCDWVMILDGDEVWHNKAILNAKCQMINDKYDVFVSPVRMLVGDIYHWQEDRAGKYAIAGKTGHYNVRFFRRNISGLHLGGAYPNEAYLNGQDVKVQNFPPERILFLDEPYLHASYLREQNFHESKVKCELGNSFPTDYYYPEVFFKLRPSIVSSPWTKRTSRYFMKALILSPIKIIKRRLV